MTKRISNPTFVTIGSVAAAIVAMGTAWTYAGPYVNGPDNLAKLTSTVDSKISSDLKRDRETDLRLQSIQRDVSDIKWSLKISNPTTFVNTENLTVNNAP